MNVNLKAAPADAGGAVDRKERPIASFRFHKEIASRREHSNWQSSAAAAGRNVPNAGLTVSANRDLIPAG